VQRISTGINNILSSFAIVKSNSKIKPFWGYLSSILTAKPLFLLWIQRLSILIFMFSAVEGMAQGESIKLDSAVVAVDTLQQAEGGLENVVDYEAFDSIELDLANKMAFLYGDAHVIYGDIDLKADYIRIDFEAKRLFATSVLDSLGNPGVPVHFKNGDNEFDSDTVEYDFGSKRARVSSVRMDYDGSYIHLDQVFRDSDGSIIGNTGKFTTCNLDHPHFYFRARKLKVIPNDKVVFGPANLVLEDVPTPLFLPFGIFPVKKDRKSGLIFPSPEMGGFRGFGLTNLGWHFHISDKLNLTLSADAYFGGSYKLSAASQYAQRYKYNGNLSFSYGYSIISGSKEENNLVASNDYAFNWQHYENAKNHPGRTFSANIQLNGGNYNQNFPQNSNRFGNSQFTSSISYSKVLWKNWFTLSANAQASQNTSTQTLTATAPSVALTMQRKFPFKSKNSSKKRLLDNLGVSYTGNFSNNIIRSDSGIFDLETWREPWQNSNKTIAHFVPVSMSFSFLNNYFNLSPFINIRQNWFFQEYQIGYDFTNFKVDTLNYTQGIFGIQNDFNFGADLRTNVFGTYQFKKGNLKAIRHILTPSVGFSYTPDFTKPSYGYARTYSDTFGQVSYNRFTGQRMYSGEQGNINMSLANVISGKRVVSDSAKDDDGKFNIIDRLTLSSSYNLLADSYNWSNIATSLNTTLFKRINLNASASFSPYTLNAEGRREREFFISTGKGIAQIQSANIGLSANLNPRVAEKRRKELRRVDAENRFMYDMLRNQFLDFSIPWSLSLNGNANYNPFAIAGTNKWNVVPSFNGDVSISPLWKATFSSGYDLINKSISETTRIGLARNLHCWILKFDWNPVGNRKSFVFTLQPNASMLQDLKLSKRNYWWNLF